MALSHNPRLVKTLLAITVPCAGPLGIIHMFFPRLLESTFGAAAAKSPFEFSDGFMGGVFLAFATTAAIGLLSPNPGEFYPLIILQCAYKVYHLLAMALARAPLNTHNLFYITGWLAFIAADVAVFTTRERKTKAGGKDT